AALREEEAVQQRLEDHEDGDDHAAEQPLAAAHNPGQPVEAVLAPEREVLGVSAFRLLLQSGEMIRVVDGADAEVADGALSRALHLDAQLRGDDRVADAALVELEGGTVLLGGLA